MLFAGFEKAYDFLMCFVAFGLSKSKQRLEIDMNIKNTKTLPVLFVVALLSASFSNVVSAGSLDKKLQQCKQEFSLSHQKDATQEVAVAAKLKHLRLMKDIIHELNVKNTDKKMSNAELQENVMVMSHLLEMMAVENLSQKDQTWNMNY